MNIGERIRALRKANKLTQGQLAAAVGRTQQEIYKWEKGTTRVPADELPLIAKALRVPPHSFYDTDLFSKVDWDVQAIVSRMPQGAKQQLLVFLYEVFGNKPCSSREGMSGASCIEMTETGHQPPGDACAG